MLLLRRSWCRRGGFSQVGKQPAGYCLAILLFMHSSGHSFRCKAVCCNAVCTRTLTGISKSAQGKMRRADFCSLPEKHLLWFLVPKWPAAKSVLCEIIYQVTQQRLFSAGPFFLFYLDSNDFTKDELLAPSHTLYLCGEHIGFAHHADGGIFPQHRLWLNTYMNPCETNAKLFLI